MFFNSLPQCGLYLFPGSPGYGPCFRLHAAGYSKKRPLGGDVTKHKTLI